MNASPSNPRKPPRELERNKYVDAQNGWRFFVFSTLIAALIGLSFHLYFSPARIKSVIEAALEKQTGASGFSFEQARLSLSRGSRPQFALVLEQVHFAPAPQCHPDPSLSIAELTVPFSLSALFQGRIAVGILSAQDLTIDLDGMKANCDKAPATTESTRDQGATLKRNIAQVQKPPASKILWWTPEQLKTAQQLMEGFDFEKVDLQFEDRTKHVYLESMSARSSLGDNNITVRTEVRIPPDLVYGEKVPILKLEADVTSELAKVGLRAGFSEGVLEGSADLTPLTANALQIDTNVKIHEVPLSTIVPLLHKSGILQSDFQPKFQWLSCEAKIKGPFQGLFDTSSLNLKGCSIEGAESKIVLDHATRLPNGDWEPFHVVLTNLDMNRVLAMFNIEGPAGISSDFGRLGGAIDVENSRTATFKGQLEGVSLMFSSREMHSEQKIKSCTLELGMDEETIHATIRNVVLTGGEADLKAEAEYEKATGLGEASFDLDKLKFDPAVNRLMLGGELQDLKGEGKITFQKSAVQTAVLKLTALGLSSDELNIDQLNINTDYKIGGVVNLHSKGANLKISPSAGWFKGVRPVFLAHEFDLDDNADIAATDFQLQGEIPDEGGLRWRSASALFENGKILLSSSGAFTRNFELSGGLTTDFPLVKKLQWLLSGTLDQPKVTRNEKSFQSIRRATFDDRTLGLPLKTAAVAEEPTLDEESKGALREIGQKVLEKARNILPKGEAGHEPTPHSK